MNADPGLSLRKARFCLDCPVCRRARLTQRGAAYLFVKHIDSRFCPYCKAYEKTTGRKAYEPVEANTAGKLMAES